MSAHPIRWESWELNADADRRFRLICMEVAVPVLIFGIAMSILHFEREAPPPLPPPVRQYAQLLPPPPPPKPKVEPVPEPAPVEAPKPEPEPKPKKPEPKPEPKKPEPKPEPTPEQLAEQARQRAAKSGLMSLSEDLAQLRDSQTADRVASGAATISGTGAPAKQASSSLGVTRGSGGINTGSLSRGTGATGLSERSTAKVQAEPGSAAGKAAKGSGGRDREEVEEVFDQNKGAIYALYNRALRDNPALQGKLVLRLTIEPDGSVSSCSIVSSELKDPELEAKLVERVKLFRFKAKDVGVVTTTKPLDFFPAN
ncbi:MAG: hypothetical protein JWQ90_4320 [Hydrocarboniphaga sp.]|uniref:AgmX/PglI C-terminal domain-containing protein n=1 Tax=Hydrocarboniphaga sp. TaxID=2033016 RepID=UPI0026144936|nr:AgmX/PglI C-terminal domain-containing protein [Hydrocarboniphaga sp.]MDB5971870.1 hypothetical protein [Hydrocarboniphaga sp.]